MWLQAINYVLKTMPYGGGFVKRFFAQFGWWSTEKADIVQRSMPVGPIKI